MTELQHFNLFRKYRVLSKNDDDIFNIRYAITDDSKVPRRKDEEQSKEKQERQVSKEEKKVVKDNSKEHEKKFVPAVYNRYKAHGSESGKEVKPKPKYKKKEWKEKIGEVKEKTEQVQHVGQVEQVQEIIGEKEQNLKKQMKQVEKNMEKDQITKSNEQYELIEKLADQEDESDEEELDKLEPIPFISKRSKSSQFNEVFSQMDLARKSQLFIRDARKLYDDYMDIQDIEHSRNNNEGIYYRGTTQFSDTVKWYCNIISNQLEGSLIVEGRNTNRALHEDQVYFKVISQGTDKVLCAVVAIVKRRLNEIVGKIQLNKTKQLYLLKPTNAKFAMMNINLLEINKEWLPNVYTKYFLAKFAYWQATDDHPYCKIISEYGICGQVEIETMALLKNYGIQNRDYSEKELQEYLEPFHKNIDNSGQYVIPAQELKKRKDFRKWRTFIVKNCEFDAAFSISPLNIRGKTDPNFLKKNIYEVNVHFIDVAYFVHEKSALDEQAKKKQASYNLVYKVLQLLPSPLSDTICNLRRNKETLTLSVGFQIDEEGNILDTSKIAKSIISPLFIFSIDEIQRVITSQVPFEEWRSWNCGCQMASQYKAISADIRLINKVISKRRQSRIQNGALAFEIPTKSFKFDQNIAPTSFQLKAKNQANFMIDQCVISASTKVGEYLFKNLKGKAILYRHRFPGFKRINKFRDSLKKMGQNLPENSKEIQKFINEIIVNGQAKQCIKDVIRYQTIKLLQNFDYFQVVNSDPTVWTHYAINTPIYTHCSTPKRYYGDLLVQRQLASILDSQPMAMEQPQMKDLIDACNKGKMIAQNIRIGCQKLFLCLYLNKNPVFTNAVLTSIEQWGLKICIPKFNFKTMINFKDLKSIQVTKINTDELRKSVKLDFTSEEDFKTKIVLKEMQEINIQIKSANTYPLDYAFNIVLPHPTLPEQKLVIS